MRGCLPQLLLLLSGAAAAAASRAAADAATDAGERAVAAELTYTPLSAASAPEALCNDGTRAGYYFSAGANASSLWLIFLESGGWCYDATSCAKRSPDQTSSKNRAAGSALSLEGIFASADPRLAAANKVYVPAATDSENLVAIAAAVEPVLQQFATASGLTTPTIGTVMAYAQALQQSLKAAQPAPAA